MGGGGGSREVSESLEDWARLLLRHGRGAFLLVIRVLYLDGLMPGHIVVLTLVTIRQLAIVNVTDMHLRIDETVDLKGFGDFRGDFCRASGLGRPDKLNTDYVSTRT